MALKIQSPRSENFILTNVRLIDPTTKIDGPKELRFEKGMVQDVVSAGTYHGKLAPEGFELVDGQGLTCVPGLVDMHVHLREPGQEYKETIATGTRAAA